MEKSNKSKGGIAKNSRMTVEERKALSEKMVEAKKERAKIPVATHTGSFSIGETIIDCAVLSNGTRLLSERAIARAFGAKRGGAHWRRKKANPDGADLPVYASANNIVPFINKDLMMALTSTVQYRNNGGAIANGLPAKHLPEICDVWLKARDADALHPSQTHLAVQADILMRGLAHVGIIALVDEATGYQKERDRDDLAKILEAFVAKELQPYLKTFPPEYYEELFRLYGLPYPPVGNKSWRPGFFGGVTNEVVYSRLAPNLLPELKKTASKAARSAKLHQWLTQDIGHPKLREHLASIVSIMKLSDTPDAFRANVDKVHPRYGDSLPLDLGA